MPKKKPRVSGWRRGDPHQAFIRGRAQAKLKGIAWTLTEAVFFELYLKPCTYCQFTFHRGWGTGLDQQVPGAGYTKDNVVPCCFECNKIKSNKYTHAEMKRVGKVLRLIKLKRGES